MGYIVGDYHKAEQRRLIPLSKVGCIVHGLELQNNKGQVNYRVHGTQLQQHMKLRLLMEYKYFD